MKTTPIKTRTIGAMLIMGLVISACIKNRETPPLPPVKVPVTYATLSAFLADNAVKTETFSVQVADGGTFTSAKGTKVTIKPNTLVDMNNMPLGGKVKIEFKDIYKKSDMLFSDMPVMLGNGAPLKSAGEFFIKITQDGNDVNLAHNKAILIEQPLNGMPMDSAIKPFVFGKGAGGAGWQPAFGDSLGAGDTLHYLANSYVFSLYKFSQPVSNGTWCNSDNSTYFSAYTQTTLTMVPDFVLADYDVNVYIVFKGINSMVHVYQNAGNFPYAYAPTGLPCTVVAVGVKDKKIYSSFNDITIGTNQSVHIGLTETTSDDFRAKIDGLN